MTATQPVEADTLEHSVAIRPRAEADWRPLLALWVNAWRATYPEIDFEARQDWLIRHMTALEAQGAKTLCATDGAGSLAGFVVIDPLSGWLDQICVALDHFGGGVGETLLAAAKNVAPGFIRLDVNADNNRAIRFYERSGFSKVGAGASTLSGRATVIMEWRGNS